MQTIPPLRVVALGLTLSAGLTSVAAAQAADSVTRLRTVTVTATRRPTDVQDVPAPVAVIDSGLLRRRAPAAVAELFRDLAGVDVVGIGGNQMRPAIRGQRGQRILLLQDGLRLGNSRRQQDFGELPALVDLNSIQRVEVVRGPSSVLYGTDAIGGVVNLITVAPTGRVEQGRISGRVGTRYSGAGNSTRGDGQVMYRQGGLSAMVGGSLRKADDYKAPAGEYGKVTLADDTPVIDAGVEDQSLNGYLGWRSATGHGLYARAERYRAEKAGFGLIEPALLGDDTRIQIRYPDQLLQKVTAGFNSGLLSLPVADRVDVSLYRQTNGRDLAQKIFVGFGAGTPPGSGVDIRTANRTDVTSLGMRAEASKGFSRGTLTYGADWFNDDATGRDSSWTAVVGFGPPRPTVSLRSQVPNATMNSLGVFAQHDWRVRERWNLVAGARYQRTAAEPKVVTPTAKEVTNSTGVFAVNSLWRLSDAVNLVATVGRGFRAPNLVERYFDGPTPEGSAYQSATPELKPEQSLNTDVGVRWQTATISAEAFVFQNRIEDGIRIAFAGDSVGRLPRYRNVNVSRLRSRGAEVGLVATLPAGFTASGNYSKLVSKNLNDPAIPVGDVYASKLNLAAGYRSAGGRWWTEYAIRHNGRQKDVVAGSSPVGDEFPSFTVQALRGGVRLWSVRGVTQDLQLQVNNLTDRLYAEVANAGFFRPEARRHVVISLDVRYQ